MQVSFQPQKTTNFGAKFSPNYTKLVYEPAKKALLEMRYLPASAFREKGAKFAFTTEAMKQIFADKTLDCEKLKNGLLKLFLVDTIDPTKGRIDLGEVVANVRQSFSHTDTYRKMLAKHDGTFEPKVRVFY